MAHDYRCAHKLSGESLPQSTAMKRTINYVWPTLFASLMAISVAIYLNLNSLQSKPLEKAQISEVKPVFEPFANRSSLVVWTALKSGNHGSSVFHAINESCSRLNHTVTDACDTDGNWDVLWSHEYFFDRFDSDFRNLRLKPHQLLNHVPSVTFLTNKQHLSVNTISRYIPSSFNFPTLKNEFLYFAKLNPAQRFVVKNMDRGGIRCELFDGVDLKLPTSQFVQAYIDPRLIYGRAFDINVYALVVSMEPLRIYRWSADSLVRFCREKFSPFNRSVTEKFHCGFNHLNVWEIPELEPRLGLSNMDIVKGALSKQPLTIDEQIDDAIATIALDKNKITQRYTGMYLNRTGNRLEHFFELLRFDFVVDNDFDVYLLEVNMSPDMDFRHETNDRNEAMAQRVMRDTLRIVGAESYEDYALYRNYTITPQKSALIDLQRCKECSESCENPACDLCIACMPEDLQRSLYHMFREHNRRGAYKRVFPTNKYDYTEYRDMMTEKTLKIFRWTVEKCKEDSDWC